MLRRMTPFLWALILSLPLAACTTMNGADADYDFATWDADRNMALDRYEWRTGFADTDLWNDWDADNDGYLDDDELATGTFGTWDLDADTYLDENEWNEARAWLAERSDVRTAFADDFNEWDLNRDRRLDTTEWGTGFDDTLWTGWDMNDDRRLGRDEWADTVYDLWDDNDDDFLDENEWDAGFDDWT